MDVDDDDVFVRVLSGCAMVCCVMMCYFVMHNLLRMMDHEKKSRIMELKHLVNGTRTGGRGIEVVEA